MKKQLIVVMAMALAGMGASVMQAAASSSSQALKAQERGMQESFSRATCAAQQADAKRAAADVAVGSGGTLRQRRVVNLREELKAADATRRRAVAAKRIVVAAGDIAAEAKEARESKEEASLTPRVSDAFKKELRAAVKTREKRIEEDRHNTCVICGNYCWPDNPNVVVLPCDEAERIAAEAEGRVLERREVVLHALCKNCMIETLKHSTLLREGRVCCPACRAPYSQDLLRYIDSLINSPEHLRLGMLRLFEENRALRAQIRNQGQILPPPVGRGTLLDDVEGFIQDAIVVVGLACVGALMHGLANATSGDSIAAGATRGFLIPGSSGMAFIFAKMMYLLCKDSREQQQR